jgi:hypothetical protein
MRKAATTETVTALLTGAQATAEALKAFTALGGHCARRGIAAHVEDLIDRLAPCVGGKVDAVYAPLFRS